MKVAVAYENGEIYGSFFPCPQFALYEYGEYVSDCIKTLIDSSELEGEQALAEKMIELGVDAVLCGFMTVEAKVRLISADIVPVTGYSGDADTASDLLVTGRLPALSSQGGCGGGCGGGCSCGDEGCGCGGDEGGCGCGCGGYQ